MNKYMNFQNLKKHLVRYDPISKTVQTQEFRPLTLLSNKKALIISPYPCKLLF